MYLKIFNYIVVFILVFSLFNDTFTVSLFGEYILKVILVLFFVFNLKTIFNNLFESHNGVLKAFLLFVTTLTITMLLTNIFYLQETLTKGILYIASMVVIFFYFSYYKELEKLLYMIWIVMIVSIIVSFFNDPISEYTFRKTGATADANEFSAQLLSFLFISIYLFNKNRNYFFIIVTVLLFFYAILYAGSKSALLFLIVLSLYTFVVKFKRYLIRFLSIKTLLLLLVTFIALYKFDVINSEVVQGVIARTEDSTTLTARYESWKAGYQMIRHDFLLGVGFDSYMENTEKYLRIFMDEANRAPHNIYIKIFAESGIFTMLAFLFFLTYLFSRKYSKIVKSDFYWLHLASLTYALMGITIGNLYDKYFWLGLAIISNVIINIEKRELEDEDIAYNT